MSKTKKARRHKGRRSGPMLAESMDRHILYEEAVQAVECDLEFLERIFRKARGRSVHSMREDFCGTAAMACAFVAQDARNRAWGIDLHQPTLDWGAQHHVSRLRDGASDRVTLVRGDVLKAKTPPTDVTVAFNFSYWIFKSRDLLRTYFRKVYDDLADDGIFFLDSFGGQEAMGHKKDRNRIAKTVRPNGGKVPKYTYIWDQARFNTISHDICCHIHFAFNDGSKLKKAFTYHWRLWTLPELQELLKEAGFKRVDVYLHGWDDGGESDDIYRRRTFYENESAWVGYLVARK